MHALLEAACDTLIGAGYAPEMAYLECVHQLTWLAATVHREGIAGTRRAISSTALYGDLTRGPRIVDDSSRAAMREILAEIRSGAFAKEFVRESAAGLASARRNLSRLELEPTEVAGRELRRRLGMLGEDHEEPESGSRG
jgi:ketol-acid reductoisomerase